MQIIDFKALIYCIFTVSVIIFSCSDQNDDRKAADISSPPSLSSEVGAGVKTVRLTETQAGELDIKVVTVEKTITRFPIRVPGVVAPAPGHIAAVSSPVDGRVSKIYKHEGEEVKQNEPLLEVESLEFSELVAGYLEAQAELNYLQQQVERLQSLTEKKITTQSALDRANADLSRARTRLQATQARLQALGLKQNIIQGWNDSIDREPVVLAYYAPIDGKINHHLIELGQSVNKNDMILDIINNKQVLVRGFVDPEDIGYLQAGAKATVMSRANQNKGADNFQVDTEITTIQPGLDRENKSIIVNSLVNTRNEWPVIGQSIRIEYEAITPGEVIAIPMSAIQFDGKKAMIFVKKDEFVYENRPVVITRMLTNRAIIDSGLLPGEQIAVTGLFNLKALAKFEEYSEE